LHKSLNGTKKIDQLRLATNGPFPDRGFRFY
jgi:hypothetical protein